MDLNLQVITSEIIHTKRQEILDTFSISEKIELLFSVRIMDECIDIPKCDSIYITYPSKSKIRTIQRMCRCIRVNQSNKFKIGNIYIWCTEYDEILDTLSGIKEYDTLFKDKISVLEIDWTKKSKLTQVVTNQKLIEKYIIGIKEYKAKSWEEKLNLVKKYIDENQKRPSY